MIHGRTQQFDSRIRMLVHAHADPALTAAMRSVSEIGEPWFPIVVGAPAVMWFVRKGWRRSVFLLAITVASAEVLGQLLKLMFHREEWDPDAFSPDDVNQRLHARRRRRPGPPPRLTSY